MGSDGACVYLAMEHVDGPTLADVLGAGRTPGSTARGDAGRIAERWALGSPAGDLVACGIVERVGRAVAAMHTLGLHHRDIKPANILIDANGNPRIADFGVATLLKPDESTRQELLGTPDYLPPEDLRFRRTVDAARTDQWACGALLYELLTEQRPYGPGTRTQIVEAGEQGRVTDAIELRTDLSPELAAVVRKSMAPEPDARYPNLNALADDLARALAGRPTSVSPSSLLGRAIMAWRRHRLVASAALALLLVGAGITALLEGSPGEASPRYEIRCESVAPAMVRDRASSPDPSLVDLSKLPVGRLLPESGTAQVETGAALLLQIEPADAAATNEPVWIYVVNRGTSGAIHVAVPTLGQPNPFSFPPDRTSLRVPLGVLGGPAGRDDFLVVSTPQRSPYMDLLCAEAARGVALTSSDLAHAVRGLVRGRRDVLAADAPLPHTEAGAADWIWSAPLNEIRRNLGPDVQRWSITHD